MKTEFASIVDINGGEIRDKTDYGAKQVVESFNDPNHDPKGKGKVVTTLIFQEDDNGIVYVSGDVKTTLVPMRKSKIAMAKGTIINPLTGEPATVLREMNGQAVGQLDLSGNINEPVELIIGIGEVKKEAFKEMNTELDEEEK